MPVVKKTVEHSTDGSGVAQGSTGKGRRNGFSSANMAATWRLLVPWIASRIESSDQQHPK